MKRKGILVVVSGFSGAGKGTLMKQLLSTYDNYALSISATTRLPRMGEEHGKEYFFTTREEFEERIKENRLIEYACYCENYYGTPRDYVEERLEEGKNVILEIEIQGALKIKETFKDALLLFIMPPSASELKRRLEKRGTETKDVILKRLLRATEEANGIENYDYIIINHNLEECTKRLHAVIEAAKSTPSRNAAFIENVRQELNVLVKGEK